MPGYMYIVANNQDYSDYSVHGVIRSRKKLTWNSIKEHAIAQAPEMYSGEWWLDGDQVMRLLASMPDVEIVNTGWISLDVRERWDRDGEFQAEGSVSHPKESEQ